MIDSCAEWLTAYLTAGGGRVGRPIIHAAGQSAGFNYAQLARARKRIGATYTIDHSRHITYWELPVTSLPSGGMTQP